MLVAEQYISKRCFPYKQAQASNEREEGEQVQQESPSKRHPKMTQCVIHLYKKLETTTQL